MVQSALECRQLVSVFLEQGFFMKLLKTCVCPNFEVSNEAFASVRAFLSEQADLAAEHIEANFVPFFGLFHTMLLRQDDYLVQRQALKLLGQVFLHHEYR